MESQATKGLAKNVAVAAAALATVFSAPKALAGGVGGQSPCVAASDPQMQGTVYIGLAETGFHGELQSKPGERRTLSIFVRRGPAWRHPNACVTWHLVTKGLATLDEKTGELVTGADVEHGAVVKVRAELDGGARELFAQVRIFRPEANPLVGRWHEVAQLGCGGKAAPSEFEPIAELELGAAGGFSVTWHPFESYRDYWGSYQVDAAKRTVKLKIEGGNYTPSDFQGDGKFVREGPKLKLFDLWLGGSRGFSRRPACGHVFEQ